jgi:hypothetical protein
MVRSVILTSSSLPVDDLLRDAGAEVLRNMS